MAYMSTEAVGRVLESHFAQTPVDYMEDGFRESIIRNGSMASACHLFLFVGAVTFLGIFCYLKIETGSNSPAIWKALGYAFFCGSLAFLLRASNNRFSHWLNETLYEEELAKASRSRKDWLMSLLAFFREQNVLSRLEEDEWQIKHALYANRRLIPTSLPPGVPGQDSQALLQSLQDKVDTIDRSVSLELSSILETDRNLRLCRGYGVTPDELDVADIDEEDDVAQV